MDKKRITLYEVLVYVAYGYFILLGLIWFFMSFSGGFNYTAFTLVAIFAVQAYFKHRLTNLILGILAMFLSIFMLLDVLSDFNLMAKDAAYNGFIKALLALSVFSIIMSGILIFSFVKIKPKHSFGK